MAGRIQVQVEPGERYGQLAVVKEVECGRKPQGATRRRVLCQCDCGKESTPRLDSLRAGKTQSCGCLRIGHGYCMGLRVAATYQTWESMKHRCYSTGNTRYSDYGGRGITVCEKWMRFEGFLADMGDRPDGMSIDRIDNDGNYEPGNCRWATRKQQQRNMRNNRLVTFNGETRCVSDWAELTGINRSTLAKRLDRGWSDSRALTTP